MSRIVTCIEALMMPIAEVSSRLTLHAAETPELKLLPHLPDTIACDDFDVAVDEQGAVTVVEPVCGRPLIQNPSRNRRSELQIAKAFVDAVANRRELLAKVVGVVLDVCPTFPETSGCLRMHRLAEMCDVHVTTVSRALDGKVCQTPEGLAGFLHLFETK